MSDAEVEAKFHTMAACLGSERSAKLWAMRDHLLTPGTAFKDLLPLLHAPL